MKQTHSLTHPRHKPPQAVAAVKNTIRKYIKRERRKELAEGVDYWDFDCRVGLTEDTATEAHISEINKRIDAAVQEGSPTVYVEILAKPGVRQARPKDTEE